MTIDRPSRLAIQLFRPFSAFVALFFRWPFKVPWGGAIARDSCAPGRHVTAPRGARKAHRDLRKKSG